MICLFITSKVYGKDVHSMSPKFVKKKIGKRTQEKGLHLHLHYSRRRDSRHYFSNSHMQVAVIFMKNKMTGVNS